MNLEFLIAYGLGLVLGAAVAWLARRDTIDTLKEQVHWLREQEAIATDRLVHGWKEGATVAPRPLPELPKQEPLPSLLKDELQQWEDPEHRVTLEAEFRAMLGRGMTATAILKEMDNRHP